MRKSFDGKARASGELLCRLCGGLAPRLAESFSRSRLYLGNVYRHFRRDITTAAQSGINPNSISDSCIYLSQSQEMSSKRKADPADVLVNRLNVGLAKHKKLLASWSGLKPEDTSNSANSASSAQEREDDEFKDEAVGYEQCVYNRILVKFTC